MKTNELPLLQQLKNWRDKETARRYGSAMLATLGGSLVLPDGIAARIVACTHLQKIRTVEQFVFQVQWIDASLYAAQLLPILEGHLASLAPPQAVKDPASVVPASGSNDALPPPVSDMAGVLSKPTTKNAGKQPAKKTGRCCGICYQPGYYGKSFAAIVVPY